MTEENKDILIGRMIDDPTSLTEQEIDLIEIDKELRHIYEVASEVKNTGLHEKGFDMDEEWERFRPLIHQEVRPGFFAARTFFRYASVFLGAVSIAAIIFLLAYKTNLNDGSPSFADGTPVKSDKAITPNQSFQLAQTEVLTAEADCAEPDDNKVSHQPTEARISSSSRKIARSVYPDSVENVECCMDLSTDVIEELDIDEYLRIQQAKIDNDLALQYAKVIRDELANVRSVNETLQQELNFSLVINAIQKITIE